MANKSSCQVHWLAVEGPLPAYEMPNTSLRTKRSDARVFNVRSGYGSGEKGPGVAYGVRYLRGLHDPADVIALWAELNPRHVEELSDKSLHHRISDFGEKWREASYERFGPFDVNGGAHGQTKGGTCPMCGEEYDGDLPAHLPCDGS